MTTTQIVKEIRTETAHRLVNYEGKCAHLHGHSYLWRVGVSVDTVAIDPKIGMAIDFKELKNAMKSRIYDVFDHACILCADDPLARAMPKGMMKSTEGKDQRLVIVDWNPTAENMAQYVAGEIQSHLALWLNGRVGFKVDFVECWETDTSHVIYRP